MKSENPIHIKFEYDEAFESKKNILFLEMNSLKISKIIKNYKFLRLEELNRKLKLFGKIKEVIANIKKLQATLPKLKIPEILKKEKAKETSEIEEIKRRPHDEDLEYQLQEIQEKLRSISR